MTITITSVRTNSAGHKIEVAAIREDHDSRNVVARCDSGEWRRIERARVAGRSEVYGVIEGKMAILVAEVRAAEAAWSALPLTMSERILVLLDLRSAVTNAGGDLSAAIGAGEVRGYAEAATADRAAIERAVRALADYEAANQDVVAEMGRRDAVETQRLIEAGV